MSEEDKNKNINDEIDDTTNIEESLVEEASLEENSIENVPDNVKDDGLPKDAIGEIDEESSIWTPTDDVLTKVDAVEVENEENSDSVINDIPNDDFTENSTENEVATNERDNADGASSSELALENAGFKDKLLFKIKTFPNIIKGLKTKISGSNGRELLRDLIKVFKNPWVVANSLVLILALCMTFVMVSWFKLKTIKINDAISNLNDIELEAKKKEKIVKDGKITVEPFIVDKETLEKEGLLKIDEMKVKKDKFKSLLKSANELFDKNEYQEALIFYNGLVSESSDGEDKSFFNLRIGECYYYSGFYKEAINAFKAVFTSKLGVKENIWRSKFLAAKSYIKLGNHDKGRRALYELMAAGANVPSEMKELMERSYFAIANSYFNEVQSEKVNDH